MLKRTIKKIKEVFRYLLTGGSTVLLQYLILIGMVELLNINYLIATTVSIAIATTVNYIIQKYWAFHSKNSISKSALRYLLVLALNYFFTIAFMYISVDIWKWNYIISNTVAVIVTAIWTYYLYKYFVYKK